MFFAFQMDFLGRGPDTFFLMCVEKQENEREKFLA